MTTVAETFKMEKKFKLLSWNIDGLDSSGFQIRTQGVIDVIKKEQPDAIFLQEVIPASYAFIEASLPEYESFSGNYAGYFVAILTRRNIFRVDNFQIIEYPGTNMDRNLLIVHAKYNNSIDIDLMTTHHESGTEQVSSFERMEQLKLCFKRMIDAPPHRIVLFGGDLNMRERELRIVGNIPAGICDLWIETGKRNESAYTWDMLLNTNKHFPPSGSLPRARFDRLYYRPSNDTNIKCQPIDFEVKGLEKLSSIDCFCSDHCAIQACFNIT